MVSTAAHGLQVEREYIVFDPVHLVILYKEDPSLAMRVGNKI